MHDPLPNGDLHVYRLMRYCALGAAESIAVRSNGPRAAQIYFLVYAVTYGGDAPSEAPCSFHYLKVLCQWSAHKQGNIFAANAVTAYGEPTVRLTKL